MIPEVARLSRRGVMGVAAAGALTGCSGGGAKAAAPRRAPVPGAAEKARAATGSLALLKRYDAVSAAHPALASRLAPLRAEVARHAAAFGGRPPAPAPAPAGSASAPPPATAPPSTTAPPPAPAAAGVPAAPGAALSWLAAAERALADRRAAELLAAPGGLARLLASVAAAGAAHVVLLGTGTDRTETS
jgi:hypothetical protein